METKLQTDWLQLIKTSSDEITVWLAEKSDEEWLVPIADTWTIKDLIGHLTAWSDFLVDQIEMLSQGDDKKIEQIDVDRWNAAQIKSRRNWSIPEVLEEWIQSLQHIQTVIRKLPPEVFSQTWSVPWSEKPVGIADLLELWLIHLEQHRTAWSRDCKGE